MTTSALAAGDIADTPAMASVDWTRRAAWLASALLLATHPLSFFSLFVDLHASALFAIAMVGVMLWHAPQVLRDLTTPIGFLVTISLGWQVLSLLGYAVGSYYTYWATAGIAANALSYILVPQACCLVLGMAIGRDRVATSRVTRIMLISNCLAIAVGIVFYLTRPGFVAAAEERIFTYTADKYLGFLPRMNGYFNSMIMGACCYSGIAIAVFKRYRPATVLLVTVLCSVGAVLTMQRAAWVLAGGMLAVALIAVLVRSGRQWHQPVTQLGVIASLVLIGIGVLGAWYYIQQQAWFGIAAQEFDNRVAFFGTSVQERSGQWLASLSIVTSHPIGIGLGLLSHKAAEVEGLFPYAVTDGNWFRVMAETGIPGLTLFAVLTLIGVVRSALARRLDVAAPLALLLVGAIGSNVFDLYYIGFVFWLLLGIALTIPLVGQPAPQPR